MRKAEIQELVAKNLSVVTVENTEYRSRKVKLRCSLCGEVIELDRPRIWDYQPDTTLLGDHIETKHNPTYVQLQSTRNEVSKILGKILEENPNLYFSKDIHIAYGNFFHPVELPKKTIKRLKCGLCGELMPYRKDDQYWRANHWNRCSGLENEKTEEMK